MPRNNNDDEKRDKLKKLVEETKRIIEAPGLPKENLEILKVSRTMAARKDSKKRRRI